MDCFIHQSPGRLRIRVSSLKGDSEKMTRLANALQVMSGVDLVTVKRVTGSLVVYYDDKRVLPSALLGQLARYEVIPRHVIGFPRPVHARPVTRPIPAVATKAASFALSPETQKVLWMAGKVLLGLLIHRTVDKKTRAILSAFI